MMRACGILILAVASLSNVATGARLNMEKMRQETGRASSLLAYREKHAAVVGVDAEFIDFDKVIDWAKNEAGDIFKTIQEEAADTFETVKETLAEHLANFKAVLSETIKKVVSALQGIKSELGKHLASLKDVAAAELPKFYKHFDGLKVKLGKARDALTAQLLAGSFTGAGKVVQEHLAILWEETKNTANGPLKDQLLASADVLKGEASNVFGKVVEGGREKFTDVFSDTFQDATVLVHGLLSELKAELQEGGQGLAATVGQQLQESGNELVDKVKSGEFAPAAPAGLLQVSLSRHSRAALEFQLEELEAAASDLAAAAAQAASAQTEKVVDVGSSLGARLGRFAMELFDNSIKPELKKLKQQALDFVKSKLGQLREWVFKAADAAVERLSKINAFAGSKAKDLLKTYGPQAQAWASALEDHVVGVANVNLDIEKARDALQAALDENLIKRPGTLQAKMAKARVAEQPALRAELAAAEQEVNDKRTAAYKAKKQAAEALEQLAAKASEAVAGIKVSMQGALGEAKEALATELKALEEHAEEVWSVALNYGKEAKAALGEAAAALVENKNVEEGWKNLVDIGVNVLNTFIKDNGSGQCKKSAHRWCCGWGKPCDCSRDSGTPGQCSWLSYKTCCQVGTPCDCSKPAL